MKLTPAPDPARHDNPVVSVRDLHVSFIARDAMIPAVNGVSFELGKGEVLGILGESGSGKSVTLRALMRLLPADKARIQGNLNVCGKNILALDSAGLAAMRGPRIAMIFQEPMSALDPVFSVGNQIVESIRAHERVTREQARTRAIELLEMVQIPSARRRFEAYPHQLSGGLRQRAMIALALACSPELLLADEPTTALDATVQIQVLLLLRTLQRELGMAMIFVTHDLGVAIEVSDKIAVMYAGRFVETGPVAEVIGHPAHPYTQGLLGSTVHRVSKGMRLQPIIGAPPDLRALPPGCSFAPRCRYAEQRCTGLSPPEVAITAREMSSHTVRCLRSEALQYAQAPS